MQRATSANGYDKETVGIGTHHMRLRIYHISCGCPLYDIHTQANLCIGYQRVAGVSNYSLVGELPRGLREEGCGAEDQESD